MINLKEERIKFLLGYCTYACKNSEIWADFYFNCSNIKVQLELIVDELWNKNIRGYLWAWNLQNAIKQAAITKDDKFNVNGLIGKIVVNTSIITALLVSREISKYHCQIKINKEQNKILKTYI